MHNTKNAFIVVRAIGSKSKTASIYMCKGSVGIGKVLKFACKKYDKKYSRIDIILSIKLSALALNGINPHFNMVYKVHQNSLLSALATGDLKSFLREYIRYDIMVNCLQQVLLCILSFHKHTDMVHNDCYHGNFIYHRIPKGGVFWYQIGGQDVYIENMGYLWMINDFDMATECTHMMIKDYKDGMEAFQNWKTSKKFNKIVEQVMNILDDGGNNVLANILSGTNLYKSPATMQTINNIPYVL